MSYQSFKRVLGETSLERKCRFLFGASLLILIGGCLLLCGSIFANVVKDNRREYARLRVKESLQSIHWRSLETEVKSKPLVNSLSDYFSGEDYQMHAIRPPQNDPKQEHKPKDEFEAEVLALFNKSGRDRSMGDWKSTDFRERPFDKGTYQYFQPIFADSSCLICHRMGPDWGYGNPLLNEGDLMAVVCIESSDEQTQSALSGIRNVLIATAILTVFFAMIMLYVIVRYVIVKPLKHLRDVADDVSRGDLEVRADIHTADEFEEVGAAFNRMLRHIVAAQQELREVNTDLDGKVDQLAQANMRLYEMNRLKGDFMATMSHELRTPLNSIIGFSDVLAAIDALDEKQKRYVTNIQKSGRMLLEMINDILDLAKIESGRMELRLTDFQLGTVVGAVCDMARPLAEKKNIDLETFVDGAMPALHQDQGKVQQILNNLLSNAIKFTPEGGRIAVSAERDEQGDAVLTVADTGVGIAKEDQLAVFEKFRQGGALATGGDAMTREYSGTGLGLSIIKELCKLLEGEISLESELGQGSTFTVRLPRRLTNRPRLDSPLAEGLDELTKLRIGELSRPVGALLADQRAE